MTTVYTNETEKAKRVLAKILGQHGEELLSLLEWVEELKVTLDDIFEVVGRACVERVLRLSAEQVAGPRHQGKADGEVRWHGTQDGVVALSTQKIRGLRLPALTSPHLLLRAPICLGCPAF